MYFWRKPINVSPSYHMARLLKQPSLVYLAFHSVERSINVLSTWICLHLPYSEFYHKHISHENQRKEPQKIKATFYRYILLVAVSFSQLRKPICSILLDWTGILSSDVLQRRTSIFSWYLCLSWTIIPTPRPLIKSHSAVTEPFPLILSSVETKLLVVIFSIKNSFSS